MKKVLDNKEGIGLSKIIKKNQVVILTLALMLMTAGYMNYANNQENENKLLAQLGDAQLVSANLSDIGNVQNMENVDEAENGLNANEENNVSLEANANEVDNINLENIDGVENDANIEENKEESENTNIASDNVDETSNTYNETVETSSNTADDYFTKSKLERDAMYSQMLETYNGILENEKISSDQKGIAENEIKNINDRKNAIMIVENLLQTKDFENSIVFINEPSVNVVVKGSDLSTEQVAQIQNIVQRELNTEIENIHITTKQ